MLTHIVCWKYRPDAAEKEIETHVSKLKNLPNEIPGILSFKVGRDVLHLERSFDTGLVATYTDREALDAYTVHPAHREAVEIGRRLAERVVSVDFIEES